MNIQSNRFHFSLKYGIITSSFSLHLTSLLHFALIKNLALLTSLFTTLAKSNMSILGGNRGSGVLGSDTDTKTPRHAQRKKKC